MCGSGHAQPTLFTYLLSFNQKIGQTFERLIHNFEIAAKGPPEAQYQFVYLISLAFEIATK